MDLQWKIRLVDRLIKNSNGNATIKDYFSIVDQNEKSEEALEQVKKSEGLNGVKIVDKKLNGVKTVKTINSRK